MTTITQCQLRNRGYFHKLPYQNIQRCQQEVIYTSANNNKQMNKVLCRKCQQGNMESFYNPQQGKLYKRVNRKQNPYYERICSKLCSYFPVFWRKTYPFVTVISFLSNSTLTSSFILKGFRFVLYTCLQIWHTTKMIIGGTESLGFPINFRSNNHKYGTRSRPAQIIQPVR